MCETKGSIELSKGLFAHSYLIVMAWKNSRFWVDPEKEIAAVILMQVLPFYDETCIAVYQGFEELVYKHLN